MTCLRSDDPAKRIASALDFLINPPPFHPAPTKLSLSNFDGVNGDSKKERSRFGGSTWRFAGRRPEFSKLPPAAAVVESGDAGLG